MPDLELLRQAIINGDAASSAAVTREALAADCDPVELVSKYMVPAMDEVGRRFECQDYFVPELLLSARAMKKALELIRPLLAERGAASAGRVVIGTVKGDLHDIGKNLVASMLEGAGFEVFDLGVDVAPQRFVGGEGKERGDHRALRAPDDYDALDAAGRGGGSKGRHPAQCSDHDRRRAGHTAVCRTDRGGRLQRQRQRSCRPRAPAGCTIVRGPTRSPAKAPPQRSRPARASAAVPG